MSVSQIPLVINSQGTTRIILNGGRVSHPSSTSRGSESEETHRKDANSFGVVYANDLARWPLTSGNPDAFFPVGSIIIREKLSAADDERPQILAVMIKRARGFNPKGGDWEFLTVDGAMTKVQERQKTGSCLDCHAAQRERDFVFPVPASQ